MRRGDCATDLIPDRNNPGIRNYPPPPRQLERSFFFFSLLLSFSPFFLFFSLPLFPQPDCNLVSILQQPESARGFLLRRTCVSMLTHENSPRFWVHSQLNLFPACQIDQARDIKRDFYANYVRLVSPFQLFHRSPNFALRRKRYPLNLVVIIFNCKCQNVSFRTGKTERN